jgi:probable rRNA maturation factor
VTPGRPFTGFMVHVESHVGSEGIPDERQFEKWVRAALQGRRSKRRQVNIQLFDPVQARQINKTFTGKDYATNVLSFPYEPLPGEKTAVLGDIVLCPSVVATEAKEQGKKLRDHFAHLTVHGVLHLLGFDHQDEGEATRMEDQERLVLATFGIPDPYETHT